MRLIIEDTNENAGKWAARYIVDKINAHQKTSNKPFVLGLPTGSTPLSTYRELTHSIWMNMSVFRRNTLKATILS